MKVCNGPCQQGRKACPCPIACEQEDTSQSKKFIGRVVLVYIAIVLLGIITSTTVVSCIR